MRINQQYYIDKMQNTIKIKLINCNKLKCGINSFVETNIDLTDCSLEPDNIKTDFFGKYDDGGFTIYSKNAEMVIVGQINENELSIDISFPNRWNYLFDIVIFTLVGLSIMYDISTYLGLAVMLFVYVQKFFVFRNEESTKKQFLLKINEVIKNETIA